MSTNIRLAIDAARIFLYQNLTGWSLSIPSIDEYIHDATIGYKLGGDLRQNFFRVGSFTSQLGREPLSRSAVILNPSTQLGPLFLCHAGSVTERHSLVCDRLGENPNAMSAEVF